MASRGEHLDATAGREVVFCHACANEWYRDEDGLECPECFSDVTEIVTIENDPRDFDNLESDDSDSQGFAPTPHANDSDPDEADIEEHVGPDGFRYRQSTRHFPGQRHANPQIQPVLESFYDMVQDMHNPRRSPGMNSTSAQGQTSRAPRIQQTTFRSGTFGGGTASFTIVSGPGFATRQQGPPPRASDAFSTMFSNLLREMQIPVVEGQDGQPDITRHLQQMLSLFNPPGGTIGDAVYSQEALDRIVTQLMEANPQSNAAPPASQEALSKLDRRTVEAEMLAPEGKAECSICIDEVKVGDTAVFLPCKHWFHEDCVVMWLREHNTCPVCRTPIEKGPQGTSGSAGPASNTGGAGNAALYSSPNLQSSSRSSSRNGPSSPRDTRTPGSGADTPMGRTAANLVSSVHLDQPSRPQYPSQNRLNEALRSVADSESEHDRPQRSRGSTAFSYDTSRLQRRTSHSPTSPEASNSAESRARIRQRSPSPERRSTRRAGGDRETRRQSGAGPLSWLRDRFTGSGYNNDSSNRRSSRDDRQS